MRVFRPHKNTRIKSESYLIKNFSKGGGKGMLKKLYETPTFEVEHLTESDVICRASKDVIVGADDWESFSE